MLLLKKNGGRRGREGKERNGERRRERSGDVDEDVSDGIQCECEQ